jgi:hypothetical protein
VQIEHIELISKLCLNDSEITFEMWSSELNHQTMAANPDDKAHDVFCELHWLGDEYPPVRFIAEIRSIPETGKWSKRFSDGCLDFNSYHLCLMTEIGNGDFLEQSVEILKDVYCAPLRDKKRVLLQGLKNMGDDSEFGCHLYIVPNTVMELSGAYGSNSFHDLIDREGLENYAIDFSWSPPTICAAIHGILSRYAEPKRRRMQIGSTTTLLGLPERRPT